MRIYIAGPMRGIKDFNFHSFYAAEKELKAEGHEVFNPAKRDDEEYGEIFQGAGNLDDLQEFDLKGAMKADLDWICDYGEAIFMLSGWEASKGAMIEMLLGKFLGLEIIIQSAQDRWDEAERKLGE